MNETSRNAPSGIAPDIEAPATEPVTVAGHPQSEATSSAPSAEQQIHELSRRSFMMAGGAVFGAAAAWRWLITRRRDSGVPWPLRRMLEVNEQIGRDFFRSHRLLPTFPRSSAREPRGNGVFGMSEDFDLAGWRLVVDGLAPGEPFTLSLDDIKALPRKEMVTDLKCIEGWSEIVHWGGTPLAELVNNYSGENRPQPSARREMHKGQPGQDEPMPTAKPPVQLPPYVSMETPGGGYYVGLDLESALHPQTLLCYEMNGQPLTMAHGAPLRLVIPVKYGVKNIKRIGAIRFTGRRPDDYWAERGYDWYTGF